MKYRSYKNKKQINNLVINYKTGDTNQRNEIILSSLKLIKKLVNNYVSIIDLPKEDIFQIAVERTIYLLDNYINSKSNFSFPAYCAINLDMYFENLSYKYKNIEKAPSYDEIEKYKFLYSDDQNEQIDNIIERIDDLSFLSGVYSELSDRQKYVVGSRYNIDCLKHPLLSEKDTMTFKELGNFFNVSGSMINHIEKKSLKRMKEKSGNYEY